MLDILNKTGFDLPDYIEESLREICWKAHLAPANVTLILKPRNKIKGISKFPLRLQRRLKRHQSRPSGLYSMDYHTVIVRMGRQTKPEDFRFVLAHEIGHLKQHLEQKKVLKPGTPTESYANKFAIVTCNCYPKGNYRGKKKYSL